MTGTSSLYGGARAAHLHLSALPIFPAMRPNP